MKLNSVSLSVKNCIFSVFPSICFRWCCILISASHASANPSVFAPNIDLTTLLD